MVGLYRRATGTMLVIHNYCAPIERHFIDLLVLRNYFGKFNDARNSFLVFINEIYLLNKV